MNESPREESGFSTADFVAGAERRGTGAAMAQAEPPAPLFDENQAQDLRNHWNDIQASFVDEPRTAVKQADELVANAMKRLAEMFAQERDRLEHQWDRGDDISTEDLRLALQRYRSFFNRLLSV